MRDDVAVHVPEVIDGLDGEDDLGGRDGDDRDLLAHGVERVGRAVVEGVGDLVEDGLAVGVLDVALLGLDVGTVAGLLVLVHLLAAGDLLRHLAVGEDDLVHRVEDLVDADDDVHFDLPGQSGPCGLFECKELINLSSLTSIAPFIIFVKFTPALAGPL